MVMCGAYIHLVCSYVFFYTKNTPIHIVYIQHILKSNIKLRAEETHVFVEINEAFIINSVQSTSYQ